MKLKLALLAAALSLSSTAFAADKKLSLSLFGNISSFSDQDPVGTLSLAVGYLVTDSLEVGGQLLQTFSNGSTTTGVGVNAKYYFGAVGKAGATVPYVLGAVLGTSSSGGGGSSTMLQAGGGLEFTMTESAATFIEAAGVRMTSSGNSINGYQINLGVKLRF